MNEEKLKSKWGGARPGAGRPKIEKPKKMHSFRLSDEELKAVKEVLAKMRNKVILLFCLFIIGLPTLAEPLKATISYSEEDARIEAFEGVRTLSIQHSIGWDDPKYFFDLKTQNDVYAIQKTTAKYMKLFPYNMYDVVYKD